jgi:hypothetical protein
LGFPARTPSGRHNYVLRRAGLPVVHFHDLRHTGNNLTAAAGANLRELMARMGHSSTRAALIYLHSTDERQREIADALGDLAARDSRAGKQPDQPSGREPIGRNGHGAARMPHEDQRAAGRNVL